MTLWVSCCVFGLLSAADVGIRCELLKPNVKPGEPMEVVLNFSRQQDAPSELLHMSFVYDRLEIGLADGEGQIIIEPKPGPKRYGGTQSHRWGTDFATPESANCPVLVNEWFSTALPPGHYNLVVGLERIEIATTADQEIRPDGFRFVRSRLHPVDKHWELPFEVLEADDTTVQKEYEALMADIRDRSPEGKAPRERALETLVYAREPLALPYQLDLFLQEESLIDIETGFDPNPYYYDLPMRFIESNSPKTAGALAAYWRKLLDENVSMNKLDHRSFLAELILWTLHELHERGNPEVVPITRPIVDEHPRPRDPRPRPGLGL